MRLAQVSYFDVAGGAAQAAYRLHRGLVDLGAASTMLVYQRDTDDPTVAVVQPDPEADAAHREDVRATFVADSEGLDVLRAPGFIPFHTGRAVAGPALERAVHDADVVNLHWVRALVDWQTFFASRPRRQAVVWTLHDMHPFTGGCHYAAACDGFARTCGACPVLNSPPGRADDLSTRVQRRKVAALRAFSGAALHIVSPSRWLADQAARSTVFAGLPVSVIPYGLDTVRFHPGVDGAAARHALEIGPDTTVILFVAQAVTDRRKGLDVLDAALGRLAPRNDVLILVVGDGTFPFTGGWPARHIGPVADPAALARLYALADLTVVPSREDNLPNTVLESLASGTAVLGSRIGGIADMITDGENGALAPPDDIPAWSAALDRLLADPETLAAMGRRGRARAERDHALSVQARRYLDLYGQLLDRR